MAHWTDEYFADCDALRLDEVVARHTDDVAFNFNNVPVARGTDRLRRSLSEFWGSIGGFSHEVLNRWEDGDTVIAESDVHYERKDGQVVTVRTVSILHRDGDLVDRISFYNDLTPVFA